MKKINSLIVSELLINNIFLSIDYDINIKDNLITLYNVKNINILIQFEKILKNYLKFKILNFNNNNTKFYSLTIKLENE